MDYQAISEDFGFPFNRMKRSEAQAYFQWYVDQIPYRIAELERTIQNLYPEWRADKTPESLVGVRDWSKTILKKVFLTTEEYEAYQHYLREIMPPILADYLEPPYADFDPPSKRAIVTIGMYWGEVLRTAQPELQWQLFTQGKKHVDYHQPNLMTKVIWCNPQRIAAVCVGRIYDGSQPDSLLEIHQIWVKTVRQSRLEDLPQA